MGCALVLRYCRACRPGKGVEIQIGHGARSGVGIESYQLLCHEGDACGEK